MKKIFYLFVLLFFISCKKEIPSVENDIYGSPLVEILDSTDVYVWANDKVKINKDIFGINNDWATITNVSFSSFVTSLTNNGYQMLRYPGGWESEYYDWDNNSTPGWNQTPASPGASASILNTYVNNYSIVIPTVKAMNEELWSTKWWNEVALLQQTAKNAINKVGASKVKVVEIGNEWWLQWAGGVNRDDKLSKYAKTAMNIAEYIQIEFPNREFKLLINGDYSEPTEFTTIKQRFTKAYDAIDGIALHTYTGYDTATHNIDSLVSYINQCANNFNPARKYIYLSEWAPSKAYNSGKVYMEAANIIPDIIHKYARAGADAAAYWPPINSSIPGLGLFNYNYSVTFPCGQILKALSESYSGHAVSTASSKVKVAAALNDINTLTLFIMGGNEPITKVNVRIYGFDIDSILSVEKFRPNDYTQTNSAAPYITQVSSAVLDNAYNKIIFDINNEGSYEIYKVVLKKAVSFP